MDASKDSVLVNKEQHTRLTKQYNPDIPNANIYHAYITGISFYNSINTHTIDYIPFLEIGYEKLYIWTHDENMFPALVSEVNLTVKSLPFWKTAGNMINLALTYCDSFDLAGTNMEYKWIYSFDKNNSVEKSTFHNLGLIDKYLMYNGRMVRPTEIACIAPSIELISRDDKCYVAMSLMVSSFQNHYCCLICELGLSTVYEHASREPELWEQADYIPQMETAIVQACRSVESILGEPPNSKKGNRVNTHKQRWISLTGIDPDDVYEKCEVSYWEYYYNLFYSLRNPSAHSYGNINYVLKRKQTIEAQCFAVIVLRGYVEKNTKSFEESLNNLKFNRYLLSELE